MFTQTKDFVFDVNKVNPYVSMSKGFKAVKHKFFSGQAQQQHVSESDRTKYLQLKYPELNVIELAEDDPDEVIRGGGWEATYVQRSMDYWTPAQKAWLAANTNSIDEAACIRHFINCSTQRLFRGQSLDTPIPSRSWKDKFGYGIAIRDLTARGVLKTNNRYSVKNHVCKSYRLDETLLQEWIALGATDLASSAVELLTDSVKSEDQLSQDLPLRNVKVNKEPAVANLREVAQKYDDDMQLVTSCFVLSDSFREYKRRRAQLALLFIRFVINKAVMIQGDLYYYHVTYVHPNGLDKRGYEVGYGLQNLPTEYRAVALIGTGQVNVDVRKCHVVIFDYKLSVHIKALQNKYPDITKAPKHIRRELKVLQKAKVLTEQYINNKLPNIPGLTADEIKIPGLAAINGAGTRGLNQPGAIRDYIKNLHDWPESQWLPAHQAVSALFHPFKAAARVINKYEERDLTCGMQHTTQWLQQEEQAQLAPLMEAAAVNCHDGAIISESKLAEIIYDGSTAHEFTLGPDTYLSLVIKPVSKLYSYGCMVGQHITKFCGAPMYGIVKRVHEELHRDEWVRFNKPLTGIDP